MFNLLFEQLRIVKWWGQLMAAMAKLIPPHKFDRDAFLKLIKEGGLEHKPDPELIFSNGPLDGELGMYDGNNNRIVVDVLEIFLMSIWGKQPIGPADVKAKFDAKMTHVLAHEAGHWRLMQQKGEKSFADKIVLHTVFTLIGVVGAWAFYFFLGQVVWRVWMPWITAVFHLSQVGSLVVLVLINLAIVLLWVKYLSRYFFALWGVLSQSLTYRLCWHERFANAYARQAEVDSRWGQVVKVDDGH